jgi:branched-chain amino acid transport system ATP-binding protein
MTAPVVLKAEGLHKAYGGVSAVDGVSMSVAAGEIVGLIGPNGAGKSTCFNLLTGHLKPDQGRIEMLGQDVTGWPARRIWRLGVGRTFQVAATFGSMSVCENVQMGLISHHRRLRALWPHAGTLYHAEALALLDLVGLAEQAGQSCAALAYGDLKRLELAIALANAPRLLLMDEPTAGMASEERMDVMALTARIARQQGVAVLFTEHDMDVVFAHADRLLVLSRGQVLAEGHPATVAASASVQDAYLGRGSLFAQPLAGAV